MVLGAELSGAKWRPRPPPASLVPALGHAEPTLEQSLPMKKVTAVTHEV